MSTPDNNEDRPPEDLVWLVGAFAAMWGFTAGKTPTPDSATQAATNAALAGDELLLRYKERFPPS